MSEKLKLTWEGIEHMEPGTRFVYHMGYLPLSQPDKNALLVYVMAEEGLVNLTQKKIEDGLYIYYATRSRRIQ